MRSKMCYCIMERFVKMFKHYEHCRYRGVDGVVIACINFFTEEVQRLVQSEIPVVTIDHVFDGRIAVVSNNIQGMEDLVSYILKRGTERSLFRFFVRF